MKPKLNPVVILEPGQIGFDDYERIATLMKRDAITFDKDLEYGTCATASFEARRAMENISYES